jgi:putative component of toxin-antitoxin plasmid stabilization module
MKLIEIVIYATDTGKEPFSNWEDGLDKRMKAIVMKRLDRVRLVILEIPNVYKGLMVSGNCA